MRQPTGRRRAHGGAPSMRAFAGRLEHQKGARWSTPCDLEWGSPDSPVARCPALDGRLYQYPSSQRTKRTMAPKNTAAASMTPCCESGCPPTVSTGS
mmetsp:Transcript_56686/g.137100  ORF Transcript_56686/g.137100 Transcript_56686/m.137100 type:complete len:97 (+) Transcript_56686:315-605(+)